MTRIHMGSDSTLIAVASIPPRIWEQDKHVWKAWLASLDIMPHTKQQYKRMIADFYEATYKSIQNTTEDDIARYASALREDGKTASTIKQYTSPVKAYWKFAQAQQPQEVTR